MRKLEKPNFTQSEIVKSCVGNMEDEAKKRLIESKLDKFEESYTLYDNFSTKNKLHVFEEGYLIEGIEVDTLKKLYTNKFSKNDQPARWYYNAILDLSLDSMCTACGYRPADSLDHVLAKTNFPAFSVNPLNLVPMCLPCNKKKSSKKSNDKISNAIHPYYDDLERDTWLKAILVEQMPFEIDFYVDKIPTIDDELFARISNHFETFALNKLYKIYVGTEISTIIYDLKEIFHEHGTEALRDELNRSKRKYKRIYKNTWQFAFYDELSNNHWFLNELFKNEIDDILKSAKKVESTISS